MSDTISEFRERMKTATSIKCNRFNIMSGELVYHILAIYDDEEVAVKYFGKHHRWWHYHFYNIDNLFVYYVNGWIELRGDK